MDDLDFGLGASGKLRALLLVLLAVFMAAIGCGILGAPMDEMKPILGFLLKAFIGLVFGGIAAFCVLHAVRSLRAKPGLPSELTARCLTCGERTPNDLVCPVCGELPQNRAASFSVPSDEFWGQVLGATILTGVGCLGLFIMIGPYLDGERRWWALIAFFALGMLMLAVGAAGFLGFVVATWNRFKDAKDISFSCCGPERSAYGSGKLAWGKLVGLQGHGRVTVPLAARGRSEGGYRFSPGDMAFAEAIATFDAAGLIELGDVTTYEWRVGNPSGKTRLSVNEFHRTTDRRIMMMLCNTAVPPSDNGDEEFDEARFVPRVPVDSTEGAIVRFLVRYLHPSLALHDFKSKLDADPLHRTQLEMHGRVLRDRGIVVSNALVEAVLEGILRENVPQA